MILGYIFEINNDLQKIIKINSDIINQTIGIINQNFSLYNNILSLAIENRKNKLINFQREIYIVIQKAINFSIIGNNKYNKQQSEIENVRNVPKSYPIKNEMINFEKLFGETYNSYPKENIKFQTDKNDIQRSLINNNSTKYNHKNIFEKYIFDLQTNNEIRILKNNKLVYLNKKLLNTYSTSRAIKKLKKLIF